jgi:hypothetical protein
VRKERQAPQIVVLSGLPPSRLMLEMTTPRLSTAKKGLQRRKLDKEIKASAIPKVPEPKHHSCVNQSMGVKVCASQVAHGLKPHLALVWGWMVLVM